MAVASKNSSVVLDHFPDCVEPRIATKISDCTTAEAQKWMWRAADRSGTPRNTNSSMNGPGAPRSRTGPGSHRQSRHPAASALYSFPDRSLEAGELPTVRRPRRGIGLKRDRLTGARHARNSEKVPETALEV